MSQRFGNYLLHAQIGGGSLGEVFRAEDEDGSTLALKRLADAHLGNADYLEVFASEARVASQMSHQRLLGALGQGHVDNWPYLTMRLTDGSCLAERLEAGALAPSALPELIEDLCEALQAVHVAGFTHSDLSPSNVLLERNRACLTDFGAATALGKSQVRPQGTFSYMSPEQVRGQALDERSDVFSLATLLWHCISGESPFRRDAQHLTFMAVVESDPTPMGDGLRSIEEVLRTALCKTPSERVSMSELRQRLLARF